MNSAGLNSICFRSLIEGESAFPASSVTIREGAIIPGIEQKKSLSKHQQFETQKRKAAIWSQYPDDFEHGAKKQGTVILRFAT